jgi:hypothetical protein
MEFAYRVWKNNMDSIVGFKANSHAAGTTENTFIQNLDDTNRYSMIDTGSMFMKSDFLYGYTCLLPEEIHQYIDAYPMCHGIAINMLVSGMTGSSPVLVNSSYVFEQDKPLHNTLSQCLTGLSKLFGNTNPLVFNDQIVSKAYAS